MDTGQPANIPAALGSLQAAVHDRAFVARRRRVLEVDPELHADFVRAVMHRLRRVELTPWTDVVTGNVSWPANVEIVIPNATAPYYRIVPAP